METAAQQMTDTLVSGLLKVTEVMRSRLTGELGAYLHETHSQEGMLMYQRTVALTLPQGMPYLEIAARLLHQIEESWFVTRAMSMEDSEKHGIHLPDAAGRVFGTSVFEERAHGRILPSTLISVSLHGDELFDTVVKWTWPRDFVWIQLGEWDGVVPSSIRGIRRKARKKAEAKARANTKARAKGKA